MRKYEIHLPLTYSDGKPIEQEKMSDMSNKQIVEDLLQRIPDGASLHDIAREIEFIAAVLQGLDELDRGERMPIDEVERELPSWIIG
jgi:predicted transcriptional regulator